MEGMDDVQRTESHMSSPAAFVEGGIQESCNDACSICLEAFCESDPSTVTSCKHEFHLQCVLEWCQRSSNCPMCWQTISLKDRTSQELLESVQWERSSRVKPVRNSTIFHHPSLGDFELQNLPMGVSSSELKDHIVQHLAASAAIRRAQHRGQREGYRRLSAHDHSQYVVLSTHSDSRFSCHVSASLPPSGGEQAHMTLPSPVQTHQIPASTSGPAHIQTHEQGVSVHNRSSISTSSLERESRAGPSDFQSFTENWKSRLSSMSMKYKESVSRTSKGWKERLFARSTSMADIGSEVRREVNARISSISRMMERLETREDNTDGVSMSNNTNTLDTDQSDLNNVEAHHEGPRNGSQSAVLAASSALN